jgi:hypothetical protein
MNLLRLSRPTLQGEYSKKEKGTLYKELENSTRLGIINDSPFLRASVRITKALGHVPRQ